MSAEFALRLGRRAAEALMTDTCVVSRHGDEVLDPDTNLYVPAWTVVYVGPCELKFGSASTRTKDVQGQMLSLEQSILKVPYDTSADIAVDDEVDLGPNTTLRIASGFDQTYATARRFPVEALA